MSAVAGLRLVESTLEFSTPGRAAAARRAPLRVDAHGVEHPPPSTSRVRLPDRSRAPWGRPVTPPGASTCTVVVRWDAARVPIPPSSIRPGRPPPTWCRRAPRPRRRDRSSVSGERHPLHRRLQRRRHRAHLGRALLPRRALVRQDLRHAGGARRPHGDPPQQRQPPRGGRPPHHREQSRAEHGATTTRRPAPSAPSPLR